MQYTNLDEMVGGFGQIYGSFLGTQNTRSRVIIGAQKGIVLLNTPLPASSSVQGLWGNALYGMTSTAKL